MTRNKNISFNSLPTSEQVSLLIRHNAQLRRRIDVLNGENDSLLQEVKHQESLIKGLNGCVKRKVLKDIEFSIKGRIFSMELTNATKTCHKSFKLAKKEIIDIVTNEFKLR